MNKAGGGGSSAPGPTAVAACAAAQKQKALLQRGEGDISSLVDNFTVLVNVSRVGPSALPCFTSLVQAADSLLKLVFDLKQTAIFSGFASLNDHVERQTQEFNQLADKTENMLANIGEAAAASLRELENHLYSSAQKHNSRVLHGS